MKGKKLKQTIAQQSNVRLLTKQEVLDNLKKAMFKEPSFYHFHYDENERCIVMKWKKMQFSQLMKALDNSRIRREIVGDILVIPNLTDDMQELILIIKIYLVF